MSIVIPCFNGEKYLRECFDSLALQVAKNFEVIVVNDASTDNSLPLAEGLFASHGFTGVVISNSRNLGESESVNTGILAARGDVCMVLSVDDLFLPNTVHSITRAAESQPGVHGWFGDWIVKSNDTETRVNLSRTSTTRFMVKNFACLPSVGSAFRLVRGQEIPLREARWGPVADFEFWLRIATRGKLSYVNETLGIWRENPESQTSLGSCKIANKKIELANQFASRDIGGIRGGDSMRISALFQAHLLNLSGRCTLPENPLLQAFKINTFIAIKKLLSPKLSFSLLRAWLKHAS